MFRGATCGMVNQCIDGTNWAGFSQGPLDVFSQSNTRERRIPGWMEAGRNKRNSNMQASNRRSM